MIKRTFTGAVITILVYTILFFSHIPAVLYGATALLCMLAIYEMYRVCGISQRRTLFLSWLCCAVILLLRIPNDEYVLLFVFFIAIVMFGTMMRLMDRLRFDRQWYSVVLGFTVVLLFQAIPRLREWENGLYYLTFAVTACFVTDVAALLVGKAFGSHKLCPKISPKKTVEGAIGGVTCTVVIAAVVTVILGKFSPLHFDSALLMVWAILVSIVGQFGDLCMSVVKRICGVKDFGKLFPGHGGVLDRFDSHMFAIAFTLIFCALTGGFIR